MLAIFIGCDHVDPGKIAVSDIAIHFIVDSRLIAGIVTTSEVFPKYDLMRLGMHDSKVGCNWMAVDIMYFLIPIWDVM